MYLAAGCLNVESHVNLNIITILHGKIPHVSRKIFEILRVILSITRLISLKILTSFSVIFVFLVIKIGTIFSLIVF
jgi:hypothetical protein